MNERALHKVSDFLGGNAQAAFSLFRYDDERATLASLSLFTLSLVSLCFAIANLAYFRLYTLGYVEVVFFALALGALLDLRINRNIRRSAWLTVGAFGGMTLCFYWLVGGAYDSAVWIMWYPLVCFFLLGARRGLVAYGIFIGTFSAIIAVKSDDWAAIADANTLSNIFGALLATGVITCYQQITKQRAHERVTRLANSDPLTGVANRRSLVTAVKQARQRGETHSLLLLDLDHFKQINDVHGHSTGDAVLREVAVRLKSVVRDKDLVSRVGGEEFGILLSNCTLPTAQSLAERLRAQIAETSLPSDRGPIELTVTVGAASSAEGADTFEDLFNLADERLYQGKARGRNQVAAR